MRVGRKLIIKIVEQKIDKKYPELKGVEYSEICNMYLDNNTAYNKQVET